MVPSTSYLVCATPRSGSTLLCEALAKTDVAGRPAEYFEALYDTGLPRRPTDYFEGLRAIPAASWLSNHLPAEGAEARAALVQAPSYREYLDWVFAAGTTLNGVFGAKLMWGHLDHFVAYLRDMPDLSGKPVPALLEEVFPGLTYVRVVRKDRLRQAVSLWKALQTATWRIERSRAAASGADPAPKKQGEFSFDAIDYLRRQISMQEAAWTHFFEESGIEPFTIVYEDLLEGYDSAVEDTLTYLGVPVDSASTAQLDMHRQADSTSEEWIDRYLESEGTHGGPEGSA